MKVYIYIVLYQFIHIDVLVHVLLNDYVDRKQQNVIIQAFHGRNMTADINVNKLFFIYMLKAFLDISFKRILLFSIAMPNIPKLLKKKKYFLDQELLVEISDLNIIENIFDDV